MSGEHIELEIESRKVVNVDLAGLKERFAPEWTITLEECGGDEAEAEREFIIESYLAGATDEFFFGTPYDDVEYHLTRGKDDSYAG